MHFQFSCCCFLRGRLLSVSPLCYALCCLVCWNIQGFGIQLATVKYYIKACTNCMQTAVRLVSLLLLLFYYCLCVTVIRHTLYSVREVLDNRLIIYQCQLEDYTGRLASYADPLAVCQTMHGPVTQGQNHQTTDAAHDAACHCVASRTWIRERVMAWRHKMT